MKLKLLVVTYNARITDSPVISTALQDGFNPFDILVSDNSTHAEYKKGNQEFCISHGMVYFDNQGNVGLSKAYNGVIESLKNTDYDALILFDQDTEAPKDYFDKVRTSLKDYPSVLVYAPYVESPLIYISPKKFDRYKIKHWVAMNQEPQYDLACINSGLVLRKEVFSIVGMYDPFLFLDFVDYEFFRRIQKHHLPIKVLDVQLNQKFSGDSFSTRERDFRRYAIYVKDLRRYRKIHHIPYLYIEYILLRRCGQLIKHYHSLRLAMLYFNGIWKEM